MGKKHRDRLRSIAPYATPAPGSDEWKAFESFLKSKPRNAKEDAWIHEKWDKMAALVTTQYSNGAGLLADQLIRELYLEFNGRVTQHGLRSMPSSFNIGEAFMRFVPELIAFRLLPERDHIVSWNGFLDYLTGDTSLPEVSGLVSNLEEGVIYNFTNSVSPETLLLGDTERSYGVAAVSLVRNGAEVTVLLLAGERSDHGSFDRSDLEVIRNTRPYLEPISNEVGVALLEGTSLWRVIVGARFDLEDKTQDARYIMHDMTSAYSVTTDDIAAFLDPRGMFKSLFAEQNAHEIMHRLDEYSAAFELCVNALYLNEYVQAHGELVRSERYPTKYRDNLKDLRNNGTDHYVPAKEKAAFRTVEVLPAVTLDSANSRRTFVAPEFRVDKSGYWKRLQADQMGLDKHGRPIIGRTWVEKELRWVEGASGTVSTAAAPEPPAGPDPGWIYVVRSPIHPRNIFKIGLTRVDPEERARDLSNATSNPDGLFVVVDWAVGNCGMIESMVHKELAPSRISGRREFFAAPLKEIVAVVERAIAATDNPQA